MGSDLKKKKAICNMFIEVGRRGLCRGWTFNYFAYSRIGLMSTIQCTYCVYRRKSKRDWFLEIFGERH